MTQRGWNPWKLTAIGMAVVVVTALVTGLVVANWTGGERDRAAADRPASKVAGQPAHPARVSSAVAATPSKNAIEACNRYAANEAGIQRDTTGKTVEVVKDGSLYGLNENRQSDERYRAAYSSCMRARGYTS